MRALIQRHRRLGTSIAILTAIVLGACTGSSSPDPIVLAFKVTDDRDAFVEETQPLADWIAEYTGIPTEVLTVQDDSAQITALATGQAHAAYMSGGPAWIAWSTFGLEAIAAEVREDGRTSYVAGLWTRAEDEIEQIEDLRGRRSCHTGALAGTGMLVPMGYLIGHGLIDAEDLDPDDISSLERARAGFFSASKIGGGYLGAFQCLSTGEGDVATGRDTAWDDFCGGDDPQPWCLPRDQYRWLPPPDGPDPSVEETGGLARVPSHPVMVSDSLDAERRQALREALLALNDSPEGRAVMEQVLGAAGLVTSDAATHLGPYGEVVQHVPGIQEHFGGEAAP